MYLHTTTLRRKLVEHVSYRTSSQNFKGKFVNGCLESISVDGRDASFNNHPQVYKKMISFYKATEAIREPAITLTASSDNEVSGSVDERVALIIANH